MNGKTLKNNSFINITFRGFMILIPILAAVYLFRNLYLQILENIDKLMETTNLDSYSQFFLALLFTVLLIVTLAYLIGLLSTSNFATQLAQRIDEFLINNSSVYRNIKLKLDNSSQFLLENKPPIFVRFGEAERPGFLMKDADEEGRVVVFIPKNFKDFDGHVYVVLEKNIRLSKSDEDTFQYDLDHLGSDLNIE